MSNINEFGKRHAMKFMLTGIVTLAGTVGAALSVGRPVWVTALFISGFVVYLTGRVLYALGKKAS